MKEYYARFVAELVNPEFNWGDINGSFHDTIKFSARTQKEALEIAHDKRREMERKYAGYYEVTIQNVSLAKPAEPRSAI